MLGAAQWGRHSLNQISLIFDLTRFHDSLVQSSKAVHRSLGKRGVSPVYTLFTHAACWGPKNTLSLFKNTEYNTRLLLRSRSVRSSALTVRCCRCADAGAMRSAHSALETRSQPAPCAAQAYSGSPPNPATICAPPSDPAGLGGRRPAWEPSPGQQPQPSPRWRRQCCRGRPCPRSLRCCRSPHCPSRPPRLVRVRGSGV